MTEPKLALIPSAYKAGTVYSPLPSNGDGDFTFSRIGEATRVNQAGVIETVGSNVPRLDYSDGGCPSLLLEPQRTNTFLNSEPTSNENAGSGVTYESYFWENGLQKSIVFGDNSVTRFRYGGTGTLNEYNTLSFYIKMDDLGEPFPSLSISGSDKDFTFVIGGDISVNYFLKKYVGNNIWRIQATRNTTASWSNSAFNGILKSTGHSNRGFKVTGFQLEVGSYATSYIPTSGSAVTRNLDSCYGAGDSNLFNTNSGVIYLESKAIGIEPTSYTGLSLSDSSLANRIELRYAPNSNTLQLVVRVVSSAVVVLSAAIPDVTKTHKVAVQFEADNYAFWVNGVKVGTDTSGALPSGLSEFAFDDGNGANRINAKIYDARIYNTALTDEELQQLTTF